jgi:hypothetical protein
MTDMTKVIVAAGQVAQAILMIGLPAVKEILKQFEENKEPTLAELENIGSSMVKPENFFDED